MNCKFCGLVLLAIVVCVQAAGKCPLAFQPPQECFSADDFKEYSSTATSLESLYNKYVNLLTDAKLTIDGDEVNIYAKNTKNYCFLQRLGYFFQPGVNLFFGGELPQKVRKLKFHGNSIITFLEIALHHVCREQGLNADQLLYCFGKLNVTADFFEICEQYEEVDCSERSST